VLPWAGIPFGIKVLSFGEKVNLICKQKIPPKELPDTRTPKNESRVLLQSCV
jgi:hypothetical protein